MWKLKRNISILLLIILSDHPDLVRAQKGYDDSNGKIVAVNRMDETRTKTLRLDRPVTIRLLNGNKMEGLCFIEDKTTIVCGTDRIDIDSIYTINGLVLRNSKEKAYGVGLSVLAVGAAIYPIYLVIGGIGLGEGNALFVGLTLLTFDLFIMYAATSLIGIYPRRFSVVNWELRFEPSGQELLFIPDELPKIKY